MKRIVTKITIFCSLFLILWSMDSCTDLLTEGKNQIDGSKGQVRIYLSEEAVSDSAGNGSNANEIVISNPKTFMPLSSNASYTLVFTPVSNGTPITITQGVTPGTPLTQALETGVWNVEVTRNEIINGASNVVARYTGSFTITAGTTTQLTVGLQPVPGGSGFLKYTISCTVSGAKASLAVTPASGNSQVQYGFTSQVVPASGLSGSLTLPEGDYDVFVSLVTTDRKGTGKYSAARIYPGLETSTDNFFSFTADNFIQNIYLSGSLAIDLPTGISINTVDVIAKNPAGVQVGSTTLSGVSDWSLNTWIMKCDQTYRSVYLTVIAHGVDSQTSASNAFISTKDKTSNTIWLVENIPDNGKTGIQLSTGIYDITNPNQSGDNKIKVTVQNEQRTAASSGEQVALDVTSHYGLKTDSLTVNGTALPGSGNQYSFVMPSQAVTLGANFFTATLGSLGIITLPSGVSVSLPDFDPDKTDYQVEVPDDVTAVIIAATAIDNATVFINGGTSPIISLDPDGDIITISVTPPAIGGGTNSSRIYTITITRTPSDP